MSSQSVLALGIIALAVASLAHMALSRRWKHTAAQDRVEYTPSGDTSNQQQ